MKKLIVLSLFAGACLQALSANTFGDLSASVGASVVDASAHVEKATQKVEEVAKVVTDLAELAKQSEKRAAATAGEPVDVDLLKEKVEEAIKLFRADGLKALTSLQGESSPFIFSGTYIWVHDEDNKMVMHPIKYKMNGKSLVSYCDTEGKFFFTQMTDLVKEKGQGWVDYMWPKPGESTPSQKVSFVKGVQVAGKTYILGCGIYDVDPAVIKKLTQN